MTMKSSSAHDGAATPASEPASDPTVDPAGSPNILGPALIPPKMGVKPEHTKPIWYVAMIVLAQFGLFLALLTPVMVSMQLKVNTLTSDASEQAAMIGAILPWGALAALVFNVVGGRISDRTTGRWGRRRPWMILGIAGLALSLVIVALGTNTVTLAIGWFLAQSLANLGYAAFTASMADQLSDRQYGTVSGLVAVAQNVAIMAGTWLASFLSHNILLLLLVPALIGFVLMSLYALCIPEPILKENKYPFNWKELLQTFWVNPVAHPDYTWAWIGRFLIIFASFMFTTFRLQYMTQHLQLDQDAAVSAVALGVTIYTVATMITGVVGGWLSDRFQRRKILVAISILVFALGTYLLMHAESVEFFYVCEAIMGAAYGVYGAVDMALVFEVLPDQANTGKDLGVFNIANALPQSLAPAFGSWALVSLGSGTDFAPLLVSAAVIGGLGSVVTMFIKSVR
ncbi:MAG: MFS transporter [Actinomyces sp.]|nr:MFS transporter [Actinomyces sp.]MCI1829765.1 MFS transporter [Actinomyces sp.]